MANSKKHPNPLTFFREVREARAKQFSKGGIYEEGGPNGLSKKEQRRAFRLAKIQARNQPKSVTNYYNNSSYNLSNSNQNAGSSSYATNENQNTSSSMSGSNATARGGSSTAQGGNSNVRATGGNDYSTNANNSSNVTGGTQNLTGQQNVNSQNKRRGGPTKSKVKKRNTKK